MVARFQRDRERPSIMGDGRSGSKADLRARVRGRTTVVERQLGSDLDRFRSSGTSRQSRALARGRASFDLGATRCILYRSGISAVAGPGSRGQLALSG